MDSSKISLSSPSVEPSNLVGDITARLRKMFHDSDVKVVVLPDVDRSTDESTARCFQKNGTWCSRLSLEEWKRIKKCHLSACAGLREKILG